jgi:hypothetical protein
VAVGNRAAGAPQEDVGWDPWLIVTLIVTAVLAAYHLSWGVHGNQSWAADALGPITVLGVIRHSFSAWNSGWYYFKYALGYPLLLGAVYAPYLGYLLLTGGWRHPTANYPYGFADPERALYVLTLIGRGCNVALTVGIVALVYATARVLGGRSVARLSAWLAATCYPFIYYAHTTNVDTAYVFWLLLALYAAVRASRSERRWPWLLLGIGAGMTLATKEQGFAFLLPLPLLALGAHVRAQRSARILWSRSTWLMALAGLVSWLVASNALFNPLGFVSRIAFILGRPLQPTSIRLLSVEFRLFKGMRELTYLQELWSGVDSALGTAGACLLVAAAMAALRRSRAATWLLVPILSYYYLALRGMGLITLRYVLPVLAVGAILVALLLIDVWRSARTATARNAIAGLIVLVAGLSLARSVELDYLLHTDARYQAEAWIRDNVPANAKGEYYQKPVYLPRFGEQPVARLVPMPERTVAGLAERQPDFVIVSSMSRKSITTIWNPDWRSTGTLLLPVPEAERFMSELKGGRLGYQVAAEFDQDPRLLRSRITSICPTITIYTRNGEGAAHADT